MESGLFLNSVPSPGCVTPDPNTYCPCGFRDAAPGGPELECSDTTTLPQPPGHPAGPPGSSAHSHCTPPSPHTRTPTHGLGPTCQAASDLRWPAEPAPATSLGIRGPRSRRAAAALQLPAGLYFGDIRVLGGPAPRPSGPWTVRSQPWSAACPCWKRPRAADRISFGTRGMLPGGEPIRALRAKDRCNPSDAVALDLGPPPSLLRQTGYARASRHKPTCLMEAGGARDRARWSALLHGRLSRLIMYAAGALR